MSSKLRDHFQLEYDWATIVHCMLSKVRIICASHMSQPLTFHSGFGWTAPTSGLEGRPAFGGTCYSAYTGTRVFTQYDASTLVGTMTFTTPGAGFAHPMDGFALAAETAPSTPTPTPNMSSSSSTSISTLAIALIAVGCVLLLLALIGGGLILCCYRKRAARRAAALAASKSVQSDPFKSYASSSAGFKTPITPIRPDVANPNAKLYPNLVSPISHASSMSRTGSYKDIKPLPTPPPAYGNLGNAYAPRLRSESRGKSTRLASVHELPSQGDVAELGHEHGGGGVGTSLPLFELAPESRGPAELGDGVPSNARKGSRNDRSGEETDPLERYTSWVDEQRRISRYDDVTRSAQNHEGREGHRREESGTLGWHI